ncbi:MAG: RNA 2',3'-cyclic phosphodiesterase [Rhodobacteraceae bacterium]|nr:MAG: RNA 2',3'-cyclic phosphodiesterase [Paracoccaceae bacterium]
MIRLFAALALPGAVAARVEALQRGLPGRPPPPENLHLTLAFFGEVDEATARDLHAALEGVAAPRFALTLDGVGAFGGAKPRALYATVRPEPALERLAAKVRQAGRAAGLALPAEKFTPHVTLTRVAPGEVSATEAARLLAARSAFLAGPFDVDAFALYRSDLGRRGPSYTAVATYPLAP